VELSL
jgi:hypothetical protein